MELIFKNLWEQIQINLRYEDLNFTCHRVKIKQKICLIGHFNSLSYCKIYCHQTYLKLLSVSKLMLNFKFGLMINTSSIEKCFEDDIN